MEDLHNIVSIFTGIFHSLWSFLLWMLGTTCTSGVSPSIPTLLEIIVLAALWIASGLCAATVAELREGRRFVHLALGLALPGLYPLALFLFMPKPKYDRDPAEKPQQKQTVEEPKKPIKVKKDEDGPPTDLGMPIPSPETGSKELQATKDAVTNDTAKLKVIPQEEAEEASHSRTPSAGIRVQPQEEMQEFGKAAMDQRYFASISTDSEGRFRGPFMIETDDGRFLEALRISNALPELLVLEIAGEGGKNKNVRLPYSKIRDCKLKSDWMDQSAQS